VVSGFNRARHNVLQHRNVTGHYRDANDHTARIAATYGASTEFVGLLGQAALLLIGGNMVRDGNLSVGELAAFILYLNSFFGPIQSLVQQYNLYQQGQAAITKLDELLETHPTVEEAEDAAPLPPIKGAANPATKQVAATKQAAAKKGAPPPPSDTCLRIADDDRTPGVRVEVVLLELPFDEVLAPDAAAEAVSSGAPPARAGSALEAEPVS